MSEVGVEYDWRLDDLIAKIVARANPVQVWLFGSRARGDHDEDSDYDIMIVVDDSWPAGKANAIEAYKLIEGRKIPVDALMARQSTFVQDKGVIGTLSDIVWAEGKLLYDRDSTRSVA
jgi:predicted nucleotidyltransferase